MFLTLIYCGGLPLLIPVFTIYLFFKYWIEKIKILRTYKKPPRFDAKIHYRVMFIVPFAIFSHILFSWWIYTSQDIFPAGVSIASNG